MDEDVFVAFFVALGAYDEHKSITLFSCIGNVNIHAILLWTYIFNLGNVAALNMYIWAHVGNVPALLLWTYKIYGHM